MKFLECLRRQKLRRRSKAGNWYLVTGNWFEKIIVKDQKLATRYLKLFPFSRFRISDHSMEPSYLEGDGVLTFNWGKLRNNDVVVFTYRHANVSFWGVKRLQNQHRNKADSGYTVPCAPSIDGAKARMTSKGKSKYLIKRIDKIKGRQIFVSGDNKKMTSVIRPIYKDQIVGKVILKY